MHTSPDALALGVAPGVEVAALAVAVVAGVDDVCADDCAVDACRGCAVAEAPTMASAAMYQATRGCFTRLMVVSVGSV